MAKTGEAGGHSAGVAQASQVDQVNQVKKLAHLARLELTEPEVAVFSAQIQGVLDYMSQLQAVDVSGVEPMIHPFELATPLREDEVRPSPVGPEGQPKVLESAPETLHGGFKVPPIL